MPKHNLLIKTVKKQFLSINDSIKNLFDKIKNFKTTLKKTKLDNNSKAFFVVGAILIVILSYFTIPSFYHKSIIQLEIKNHFLKKYNVDVKFNKSVSYNLFPKPNFSTKNLSINHNQREIAVVKDLKVFIQIDKFFNLNAISIKDIILKRADFNIYLEDIRFFRNLFEAKPNENKIIVKNSNLFLNNKDDEILFLNKIYKSQIYYDSNNLQNFMSINNEIFNIPFKLVLKKDQFNRKFYTDFDSNKIRLRIENEIEYDENTKKGNLDLIFINKGISLGYQINKNSLDFKSLDRKNKFKGNIDFRPFYFFADFDYEGLSLKNLFSEQTILFDIIQSQIFNNKNLNANINLNVKDITNIDELNNLLLKINIIQGNIGFTESQLMWKDDVKIELADSLLDYSDSEINMSGRVVFNFLNINDFYKSFQISKNNRKKLKKIQIDFVYNLNQNKISFDNVKIDNVSNENIDKYIGQFNLENKGISNKIKFKNFVNNFFNSYSG